VNGRPARKDLVVLTADKNIEFAVRALLSSRLAALAIRQVNFDVFPHPERDPGCRLRAHDFLRASLRTYEHALVIFDRHGCGSEHRGRAEIESEVEAHLAGSGWGDRATTVVLDPELEAWVWGDSAQVEAHLGWDGAPNGLRPWLEQNGLWNTGDPKPHDPKEAVERALYRARKPRSSALYRRLAEAVSFSNCSDAAFQKFSSPVKTWFAG
jgi:hypothetical protein